MPIYEYRCEACGQALEVMQKLSDEALKDCPSCSRPALKKLISAAGFQLKGSGWYATDFKGGGKKPSEGSVPDSGADAKKTHKGGGKKPSEGSVPDSSADAKKTHGCGGGPCGHAH